MSEDAKKYENVTAKLVEDFGKTQNLEEELQKAIKTILGLKTMLGFLPQLKNLCERVGFNEAAWFRILLRMVAANK